jgi:hypothetical protein|tara:strand:- start:1061 stop:1483 length:423 start_codon:yes stop_codon:yes gene_type:complete
MIKIAIDIDGTITHTPKYFSHVITGQMAIGNEIHILTGAISNFYNGKYKEGNYESPIERISQLKSYGIYNWTKLIMVVRDKQFPDIADGKGEYCRDNNIDIIYEDNLGYIKSIKKISPNTLAFLICRDGIFNDNGLTGNW